METVSNDLNLSKQSIEKCVEVDFIDHQIDKHKQINKHVNSIEAKRLKERESYLKRRAKLTEEQRLKKNEYCRKWRANLTKEQRRLKKQAYLTEEQRLKAQEHDRERYANLTEEQRLKRNECARKRYLKRQDKLSEEQRLKKNEYNRKIRANLTEEQRLKRNEYDRKKQAKLTEEQIAKRREYQRNRYLKLTQNKLTQYGKNENERTTISDELEISFTIGEEKCINNPKTVCSRNIDYAKKRPKTTSEHKRIGSENPLQELIKRMRYVKHISQIDNNLLKRIEQMLGLSYPQNILVQSQFTLQKLNYEIYSILLVKLLENWEGWIIDDRIAYLSSAKSCEDLFCYLCNNFLYIKLHKEASLLEEVNNVYPSDNYVNTSCSLKQLKSLFYNSPLNHTTYYREDALVSGLSPCLGESFPSFMFNFPYISMQISFPNFSMKHLNVHVDEYHLLDITNENKSNLNFQNNCDTFSVMNNEGNVSETYLAIFISTFLSQLKIAIENHDDENIVFDKKIEIITAIIELEKDIAHCTNTIQTNTIYTIGLAQDPYIRYLGQSDDGGINISIEEQKLLDETILNVRLQEVRYPRISFTLEKFSVQYKLKNENIHFIFNESFLSNLNSCISYKCLLCDEDLGSYAPSQKISDHLLRYHGHEPDWECIKCSESFTNDFLIKHRWAHSCKRL